MCYANPYAATSFLAWGVAKYSGRWQKMSGKKNRQYAIGWHSGCGMVRQWFLDNVREMGEELLQQRKRALKRPILTLMKNES